MTTTEATDTTDPTDPTEPADPGEPTDTSEPSEPVDPARACSLLSVDDVEAVFGEAVADDSARDEYASECWWSTDGDLRTANLKLAQPDLEDWSAAHENDSWETVDLGDEGYVGVSAFSTKRRP